MPDAPANGPLGRLRLTDGLVLGFVGVLSAALHGVAIAAGLRFSSKDFSARQLSQIWQLLPTRLLRHDLVSSLAHLHSQPPLFNLVTGVLLELPRATQPLAADLGLAACAVAVAVCTAGILLEFEVKRSVVLFVVLLFVVADPAQYLYAGFYFYALPTAALATAAGWAATRWVRTERVVPGVAFGALAAMLVLTNSSYQVYTVAIASVPVLWVLRRRWRQAIAVLAVPAAVVASWYAIDVIQFHSATTSSWLGMNLARSTLSLDSSADINALIRQGVLSPTARIGPFYDLGAYGALGVHARTGQPALDQREKAGAPNFNNIAYLGISRRYLADDLKWIEHRPGHYLKNTTIGLRLWMLPAEQFYATVNLGAYHLGGYTTVYDAIAMLQPTADPTAVNDVVFAHRGPSLSNLSYTTIAESILALFVLPIVAVRRWRRRRDRALAAGALWIWAMCASVFVSTTLLEAAENNRFRF
ncbi:MAG TPA: hypothetical protein VIE15_00775, partial [Acidimicrobiales bacterium]